jgi:hypothetical protein
VESETFSYIRTYYYYYVRKLGPAACSLRTRPSSLALIRVAAS